MKNILSHFDKQSGRPQLFSAFTLAEVLITLGIIGIVAALTIPTLINKVQKMQYVVALKKFYTTQASGWTQILANEGVQNLEDTSLFQSMGQGSCYITDVNSALCTPFFDNLKESFKLEVVIAPSYQVYLLGGDKSSDFTNKSVLVFSDGSTILSGVFYKKNYTSGGTQAAIASGGGHLYAEQADILIDVNGFKKPNTYGRDIFDFIVSADGKLYPYFGKDSSLFSYGSLANYWQNNVSRCGILGSTDISNTNGYACAARIMDEGWEMNY